MSDGAPQWYPPTPVCPPDGVRVVVSWRGREFKAARVLVPGPDGQTWLTAVDGRAVYLPPVRGAEAWGPEPDAWRPENAAAWRMPLPDPLTTTDGRMWSARQRFGAVDDAEAAELAREMEHDREAARAHRDGESDTAPPPKQWWLDATQIRYSPPGEISPREAEGRLMRAIMAHRWVAVEYPADVSFGGILAGLAQTLPGSGDATSDGRIAPEPNGADHDDMLTALKWLDAVAYCGDARIEPALGVLWLRAETPPLSWRAIARRVHGSKMSHEHARRLHMIGLSLVWNAANGRPTAGTKFVEGQLAALRVRNRRYHQQARG